MTNTFTILARLYDQLRVATRSVTVLDATVAITTIWALYAAILSARRKFKTTSLRGPPRSSLIYGASKDLLKSIDAGSTFEQWAKEYGPVYEVPTILGGSKIVLCDPKAIAHYYAKETWTYIPLPATRRFMRRNVGRFTQLVSHPFHLTVSSSVRGYCRYKAKPTRGRHDIIYQGRWIFNLPRQRKSLAPAFTHAAIRNLTPIFYNSAYKVILT